MESCNVCCTIDVDSAAGAVQPMFRTGMGRPVPVSRTSIDKARAVLEGQTAAEQGHYDESIIKVLDSFLKK